jgi:hypothetical protein
MNEVRLQELRAEHAADENWQCPECVYAPWPCEQFQILDMALEAERLRAALLSIEDEHIGRGSLYFPVECGICRVNWPCTTYNLAFEARHTLAGTEAGESPTS